MNSALSCGADDLVVSICACLATEPPISRKTVATSSNAGRSCGVALTGIVLLSFEEAVWLASTKDAVGTPG